MPGGHDGDGGGGGGRDGGGEGGHDGGGEGGDGFADCGDPILQRVSTLVREYTKL